VQSWQIILMIDSSTLSLFSFQRAFFLFASQGDFSILSCPLSFCKKFFLGSFRSAATIQYFIK
ncbi:hypothetical protein KM924_27970, partial [Brevibacillus parabrevis]|uniref:hypothetical protein n=1 Tax=Brevibacillus parabrevis TaxID=54914 RepID=UPI001C23BE23